MVEPKLYYQIFNKMTKDDLIKTANDILSRVCQKDLGYNTMVDVVSDSDEQLLNEWRHQLELYLLNVPNQQVISSIEGYYPFQNGNRIRKSHLKAIVEILSNYTEK